VREGLSLTKGRADVLLKARLSVPPCPDKANSVEAVMTKRLAIMLASLLFWHSFLLDALQLAASCLQLRARRTISQEISPKADRMGFGKNCGQL